MSLRSASRLSCCIASIAFLAVEAQTLLPPVVDPQLQPARGHKLTKTLLAVGEQAYKCQAQPGGGFAWGPASIPSANLWDPWNYKSGEHGFNGTAPFWKLAAGGEVTAKRLQGVRAPDQQSIDWLLLEAQGGTGAFAGVKLIQRVYTGGGAAPKTGCDPLAAKANKIAKVGYTAAYYFWSADPSSKK